MSIKQSYGQSATYGAYSLTPLVITNILDQIFVSWPNYRKVKVKV